MLDVELEPEPEQEPTGELPPHFGEDIRVELVELAVNGIGEGDFDDPHLPDDFDWGDA